MNEQRGRALIPVPLAGLTLALVEVLPQEAGSATEGWDRFIIWLPAALSLVLDGRYGAGLLLAGIGVSSSPR